MVTGEPEGIGLLASDISADSALKWKASLATLATVVPVAALAMTIARDHRVVLAVVLAILPLAFLGFAYVGRRSRKRALLPQSPSTFSPALIGTGALMEVRLLIAFCLAITSFSFFAVWEATARLTSQLDSLDVARLEFESEMAEMKALRQSLRYQLAELEEAEARYASRARLSDHEEEARLSEASAQLAEVLRLRENLRAPRVISPAAIPSEDRIRVLALGDQLQIKSMNTNTAWLSLSIEEVSPIIVKFSAPSADLMASLYRRGTESLRLVVYDDDSGENLNPELKAALPPGDYLIRVTSYNRENLPGFDVSAHVERGDEPGKD